MKDHVLNVALLGLGQMGRNHLRILSMLKGVAVAFVYDADADVARAMADTYQVPYRADLEAALDGVEAVIICTPTTTHAHYVNLVSDRTKHIFVEKPLTESLASSLQIQKLAQAKNLDIQVGFIERFNPAVQQMKTLLEQSSGVVSVDFFRTNKFSSRITDVDVVIDLMIHDIDLALHLNGSVTAVTAHGLATGGMIDFASALLTHTNGRFSRIQTSRITDKKMRSIQATCKDMFIDCDLLRKEIIISRQTELVQKAGAPYLISAVSETLAVALQEALLSELQAFVKHSKDGSGGSVPTVRDAVTAIGICEDIRNAVLQASGQVEKRC